MSDPSISLTPQALREQIAVTLRIRVRRVFEDAHWSDARLADALGLSQSRVYQWWCSHHVPLYVLASPRIPRLLRERILAEVRGIGDADVADPALSAERGLAGVVSVIGAMIVEAGIALSDGVIDAAEARRLITVLTKARSEIDRILGTLHERAGMPRGAGLSS